MYIVHSLAQQRVLRMNWLCVAELRRVDFSPEQQQLSWMASPDFVWNKIYESYKNLSGEFTNSHILKIIMSHQRADISCTNRQIRRNLSQWVVDLSNQFKSSVDHSLCLKSQKSPSFVRDSVCSDWVVCRLSNSSRAAAANPPRYDDPFMKTIRIFTALFHPLRFYKRRALCWLPPPPLRRDSLRLILIGPMYVAATGGGKW